MERRRDFTHPALAEETEPGGLEEDVNWHGSLKRYGIRFWGRSEERSRRYEYFFHDLGVRGSGFPAVFNIMKEDVSWERIRMR